MPAAEQRDQQFLDHLRLADDHLAQLVDDFLPGRPELSMAPLL